MSAATTEDLRWLDVATRYATPSLGTSRDEPVAAALVVDSRTHALVARAVTAPGGRPHAEAQALERAGFEAAGCTLYVTIEPCQHWGRTPPCVDAIIRAGIMRVVIGSADPDPRLTGRSIKHLESAGIEVVLADHAPSAALNAGHFSRHRRGRPFVTAMLAVAPDNRIAEPTGAAGDWFALQRARSDAVLVGAATALGADPQLTVRIPGLQSRTPLRIVLAGAAGVDRRINLIGGFSGHRTAVIAETSVPVDAPLSVEVLRVAGTDSRPDLAAVLKALAGKGIQNLLVEPGPRLAASLLKARLIDRFALVDTGPGTGKGPTASPDGRMAHVLDLAGFVAGEPETIGTDTLTVYRPRA